MPLMLLALILTSCEEQTIVEPDAELAPQLKTDLAIEPLNEEKLQMKGDERPLFARKSGAYLGCPADGTTGEAIFRGYSTSDSGNFYSFTGTAGDAISIGVHRTTSAMDPVLQLRLGTVPVGTSVFTLPPVGVADDNNGIPHGVGGFFADPLLVMVLPTTGEYTLAIWDFIGAGPGPVTPYEIHTSGISCEIEVEIEVKPGKSKKSVRIRSTKSSKKSSKESRVNPESCVRVKKV